MNLLALLAADASLATRSPQNAPRAREPALVYTSGQAPKGAGQAHRVNAMSTRKKPHDARR
jgi:hypothetical protein